MPACKLTKEDAKNKFLTLAKSANGDNALLLNALKDFLIWVNENSDNFEEEANKKIDEVLKEISVLFETEILSKIPEGNEKEKLKHLLEQANNPYYIASGLVQTLVKPIDSKSHSDELKRR